MVPSRATAGSAASTGISLAALRGQRDARTRHRKRCRIVAEHGTLDGEFAGAQAERGVGPNGQGAAADVDPTDIAAKEPEGARFRHGQRTARGIERAENWPVGEVELVRGAGVERALDVDLRVRAEDDAGGVDQVKVRTLDLGCEDTVDRGALAAGHPADDVADPARASEPHPAARVDIEVPETVEQVAAAGLAELGADGDVGATQGDRRAHGPVGDHLGTRRPQAGQGQGQRGSGGKEPCPSSLMPLRCRHRVLSGWPRVA
jgi:hypothetical protein